MTDLKYQRQPGDLHRLNFLLTTHCNMRCPDCSAGVATNPTHWHASWEYVVEAASNMAGRVPHLVITGGEAMSHPNFDEWVPKLRELFKAKKMTLETNAFLAPRHEVALTYFDHIRATRYSTATFRLAIKPYSIDNASAVAWLQEHPMLSERLEVVEPLHMPLGGSPGPYPCRHHAYNAAAYHHGRLYPCCAMPGQASMPSIPLVENWELAILKVPLPCHRCFLGEMEPQP